MNITLYQLVDEFKAAAESLSDLDLPDEVITDTLEGLSGEIEAKATNVAMFARNLEVIAEQIKIAESAMSGRRKAIENRVTRIKDYLKENMERCGISKIESPYFKISIRENPPSVVIDAESLLPEQYMRQPEIPPPIPDKKLLSDDLKNGKIIPGAHLERRTRLEIK